MVAPQLTLPVPLVVVDAAASTVLRARPGRRAEILAREVEAFRVELLRQGHRPADAADFSRSFGATVRHRLREAGGRAHQ